MNKNLRVAWLLPIAWYYWQPALCEFSKFFPDTKVFTGLFPGFARGYENSLLVEEVGKFKVIPVNKSSAGYGSNLTYLSPRIIKPLLEFRPDLVFTSSFGVWTIITLLLKPLFRYQVVIAYEGSSPGVDYCNSPLRLFVRRVMVKLADAYISNSQRGRKYLTDILKANSKSVFVHPYEIPSAKTLLINNSSKIKANVPILPRPIFLFVGHLIPRKGIECLLEACMILINQGCDRFTVQIVGSGDERERLEAFCIEHHLNCNVQWLGRVEYSEIDVCFNNADVFVFPTKEETWGVVLLEAMLFGKPAICSTGAGTSEMIVDGDNGYLFNPDQPEKLAELMSKFICHYDLVELMGQKSKTIMNSFTPEAAGEFLANVVNSIYKGNKVYA